VNFEHALLVEPCVRLGPGAPGAARALLVNLDHSADACADTPAHRVALRSLVRPGFGHVHGGRSRLVGAVTLAAIGGAWMGAWISDRTAHARYADYAAYAATSEDPGQAAATAAAMFDSAEAARERGVRFAQAAVAIWATALVDGLLAERRRRAEVEALSDYGSVGEPAADRRGALLPLLAPGRLGLRLAWF
jgi:hypothetical protein